MSYNRVFMCHPQDHTVQHDTSHSKNDSDFTSHHDVMHKTTDVSTDTSTDSTKPSVDSKQSKLRHYSILPFIKLIKFYQLYISPLTPPMCRFTPTCSQYALQAYQHFGVWGGTWRTLTRLLRCHPWHAGGYDPVISYEKKNPKT